MTRTSSTIVRVNLNLDRPDKALNTMRLMVPASDGSALVQKFVGWPRLIHMQDVRPVIRNDLRKRLVSGDLKTKNNNIAMLEGKLVAWHGDVNEAADQDHIDQIMPAREDEKYFAGILKSVFEKEAGWRAIGFNPRKAGVFYATSQSWPDIKEGLEEAKEMLAAGWSYHVRGATMREVTEDEISDNVSVSDYERRNMREGVARTQDYIERLQKDLG